MRDGPIRIGLIGAARIAPRAVVVPAAESADAEVVAVAARSLDRAQAFAAEHGIPRALAGYDGLVADPSIDLVYVALPTALHAHWTEAALRAGKAVLCEKPFAGDAAEARRMVACAAAAERPLLEAFHYRFHNAFLAVEEMVRSGVLGRIVDARASFLLSLADRVDDIRWDPALGGGALGDLGCYAVHALRTLLVSEPEVIEAGARMRRGVDAGTDARLRFGNLTASISCAMDADDREAMLRLEGERGWVMLENYVQPALGHRLSTCIDGVERVRSIEGPSTYAAQLAHVVAVLRGGTEPLTGGADGIANMAALDAIRAAARP